MSNGDRQSSEQSGKQARCTAYQSKMIAKWRSEIDHIKTEVIVLYHNRDIYNKLFDIVENNPRIQKGNAFYEWMHLHYVVYAATTIRRLLDKHKRTISLHNLIHEIDIKKEYITREWYISQFPESFRKSSIPSRNFIDLAGDDPNIIGSQKLIDKLGEVESVSKIIKTYVDKLVAHADRDEPDRLPKYDELDKAIDAVGKLFQHLYGILNDSNISLKIVEEFVWVQLFEEPWIVPRDRD